MSSAPKTVFTFPTRMVIASPETILERSLKRLRRKSGLARITNQWGNARRVSLNITAFLTDCIPDANGDPLLLRCLREAVDNCQDFVRSNPGHAMHPHMFNLFLVSSLSPCVEVLRHRVVCPQGKVAWDPLTEDLQQFVFRYPTAVLRPSAGFSNEDVAVFFSALVARLVSDEDIAGIQLSREAISRELVEANQCFFSPV